MPDLTRPAGDEDVIGGVQARLVAAPRTTAEAAELLAATRGLTVVVRGAGTKIDWGPPPRSLDLIIDTSNLTGVVEHAAGDLITIVRAGTPLRSLDLGDQLLALDGPAGATIGGTVATGTSGPRRLHYGGVRDLLIGITVVRADGKIAKAGGKVVKNVAGYDLGKLYTGSYGTLGLITECAFRLHPKPQHALFVRTSAPPADAAKVRAAAVAPAAVEIDSASGELAVLLEGTAEGVRERAGLVGKLLGGDISDEAPAWWGEDPWAPGEIGVKLSVPLSAVPTLAQGPDFVRGSAGTGLLSAAAAGITEVERLRATCVRLGGHAVVLTAPPEIRDILDMWGPVPGLSLMRRVKNQFDPDHRFAPGRFVGGI
ncbi:FAD-binding oxidoreductase [Paractinoplanes durhamensis]|uniref:Glycolate oxidase n=1 Tax=Paractinoplanes durhamensis TaxID=113563 RepID=A0ABQ3YS86_9ACTN|nr:FAD-binding protein [Actinoplanes durhamensis]GIE00397.1 glycolate oxidase [Actinoplanes durhamensis]